MKALLGADQKGTAVKIDVDRLVESKLLIQAMSGGGKSYAVRGLLKRLPDGRIGLNPEVLEVCV